MWTGWDTLLSDLCSFVLLYNIRHIFSSFPLFILSSSHVSYHCNILVIFMGHGTQYGMGVFKHFLHTAHAALQTLSVAFLPCWDVGRLVVEVTSFTLRFSPPRPLPLLYYPWTGFIPCPSHTP